MDKATKTINVKKIFREINKKYKMEKTDQELCDEIEEQESRDSDHEA